VEKMRFESLWELTKFADREPDEICDYILEEIVAITRSKYGFYGFMSVNEAEMIVHAWSKQTMKECSVYDRPLRFPAEKAGIWAEAVKTKKPLVLNDYARDNPLKRGLPHGHVPVKRLAVVPVLTGNAVTSVAAVANKVEEYSPDDIDRLTLFLQNAQYIIDRRQAEARLAESEKKFRQFFDNLSDYAYMISPEGTFLNINASALKALGYERNEIVGKPLASIYSAESLIKMKMLFEEWKKSGRIVNEEMVIVTKQGEKRTVMLNVTAVRDANGKIIHSASIQKDMTDWKKDQNTLIESEKQWNDTFEAIDSGICIIDMDRKILKCNQSMSRLVKKPKKSIIGETCCKLVHNRKSPIPNCPFTKMCGSGKIESYEFQMADKWLLELAYPLYDNRGALKGAVHIFRDITAQKEFDQSLERKNIALKEVLSQVEDEKSRIKEDVVYNVRELVLPLLRKIKKEAAHSKSVTVLENTLHKITSSFGRTISAYKDNFTPREIEICNQIRSGMSSKDIAEILGTSRQTVEKQRKIIRKKLGIKKKSVNLVAFLQNIDGKREI